MCKRAGAGFHLLGPHSPHSSSNPITGSQPWGAGNLIPEFQFKSSVLELEANSLGIEQKMVLGSLSAVWQARMEVLTPGHLGGKPDGRHCPLTTTISFLSFPISFR